MKKIFVFYAVILFLTVSCREAGEYDKKETAAPGVISAEKEKQQDEKKEKTFADDAPVVYLEETEDDIDSSAAYINDILGTCLVKNKEKGSVWKNAELYTALYEGDRISTKDESTAEIVFDDSTIIVIEPQSDIVIKTLLREDDSGRTIIDLITGKLMAIVKKLEQNEEFSVATKMAVAAVKGTEFAVETGQDIHSIGVFEGEVEVTGYGSEGKPAGSISVKPERETSINTRTGKPARLKRLSQRMSERRERIKTYRSRIKRIRSLKTGGDLRKYRLERMLKRMDEYSRIKKDRKRYEKLSDIEKMRIDNMLRRKKTYERMYERQRRLDRFKNSGNNAKEEKNESPFRRHR
ncbi:MAG: FecR domain-containing protein [Candidatus Goldiibacteriota bacterium]